MGGLMGRWLCPQGATTYLDVRIDALPRLVKAGRVPAPEYQLGPATLGMTV